MPRLNDMTTISPQREKEPNTTVNMIKETVAKLNNYCRSNGKIRMYVLDDAVKEYLAKKGY